jgi:hypothetical protein
MVSFMKKIPSSRQTRRQWFSLDRIKHLISDLEQELEGIPHLDDTREEMFRFA